MFGFIRPIKPELRIREADRFQSVYCGLCHAIKQRYGRVHTIFLSYDMTFLALILSCQEKDDQTVLKKRCIASPVSCKLVCGAGEGITRAADLSVLLNYHKLCDTILDERGLKCWLARFLRIFATPGYKKAQKQCPKEDVAMRTCLCELHELEQAQTPSLDRPADTFARLLAEAVPESDDQTSRVLRQMFYHTGRWVYLLDACADLAEDWKTGSYNPVALRFGLTEPKLDKAREDMEITLRRSLADIYNAFQLLTVYRDSDLIENIICLGMPVVTQQVLDGMYQSNGGRNRHGSL